MSLMARVWALGIALNVEVPPTIKVVVRGRFNKFVGAKDLILHLIGKITAQGANFKVLEFHGPTIEQMNTSSRLTLCNMAVEGGATAGIVPADLETERYLREEAGMAEPVNYVTPDADASYEQVIDINVAKLSPQIACPHTVDNVKPVDEFTQVLSPLDVLQSTITFSRGHGWYSDPYKSTRTFYPNGAPAFMFDTRPGSRETLSWFNRYRRHFPGAEGTLQAEYRYFRDDWDVTAHTVEAGWHQSIGERWAVRVQRSIAGPDRKCSRAADFAAPDDQAESS